MRLLPVRTDSSGWFVNLIMGLERRSAPRGIPHLANIVKSPWHACVYVCVWVWVCVSVSVCECVWEACARVSARLNKIVDIYMLVCTRKSMCVVVINTVIQMELWKSMINSPYLALVWWHLLLNVWAKSHPQLFWKCMQSPRQVCSLLIVRTYVRVRR